MMRAFWLDKIWYLAFWVGVFLAARFWLVNPIVRSQEQQAFRIVRAILEAKR